MGGLTKRLRESVQEIQDLPDRGCLLTVRIGSTLEIMPWIRGWGPDVEVNRAILTQAAVCPICPQVVGDLWTTRRWGVAQTAYTLAPRYWQICQN
ncbi:MAG: hypothetical protein DDT25_00983 [Chloroflexi bacterium]|nr:hypothetical protein [Chloroflexota bacterium]